MATIEPRQVLDEYQRGILYNNRLGLYDTVRRNEDFFIGKQWEGVNAPDLEKPVNNILKRVVSYFISQIVSDDISVRIEGYGHMDGPLGGIAGGYTEATLAYINAEIQRVIENTGAKILGRDSLRDAAVDGDSCLHAYWDATAGGDFLAGEIRAELIDNTSVLFGNPRIGVVERQPYILLPTRVEVSRAINEAKTYGGDGEYASIVADREQTDQPNAQKLPDDDLVTVILRYWRDPETGGIRALKVTADGKWVRRPWDTGLRLYPLAYWTWERVKNSYHGQSPITQLIPNQIIINKIQAMLTKSVQDMAFPKIVYDRAKIDRWTNRIGEAIGVYGNPNEALARAIPGAMMQPAIQQAIDNLMAVTRDTMGATDAALGNVKPDNTSAIIAVQKAASAPLELQRMAYYQWIEDYVRVFVDMMRAYYGVRYVRPAAKDPSATPVPVDFSGLDLSRYSLKVNVGAAAYWSELTQVKTLDNLFASGLLDPAVYIENIPDAYLPGKNNIIDALKARAATLTMGGDTIGI